VPETAEGRAIFKAGQVYVIRNDIQSIIEQLSRGELPGDRSTTLKIGSVSKLTFNDKLILLENVS
jgi:hypothetical protein